MRPWQVAAATVSIGILWVLTQNQMSALRSGKPLVREFMALYTVGHVLNGSREMLYDPDSFLRTYHALFPAAPAELRPLYAHAPFEAAIFRPFALLSFEWALVAWQVFSAVLFGAGLTLVWRTSHSLPWRQLPMALLILLSFHSVAVASIARGQVGALTFFWMAVVFHCQRQRRDFCAGAALSMCLSKPTLLGLLVPMLVVGRRHRILVGFCASAAVLGALSLLVVGWRGCTDYVAMLLLFGMAATESRDSVLLSEYVDLNSFVRMAVGGRGHWGLVVLAVVTAGVLPWLVSLWRGMRTDDEVKSSMTWASTVTWTTVLNAYFASYDTPIVLLGIVLTAGVLYGTNVVAVPVVVRVFLVLLYVAPWIPPMPIGIDRTVQLYTLVLGGLGVYQIWAAMRATSRALPAHADFAPK